MELSNPRIPLVTQFPQVPQGLCPLLQRLHSRSRHELRDWAARRDAAKLPLYRLSQLSCNVAVPPHRAAAITPTGPDTLDMPSTFWKGSPKSVHYIHIAIKTCDGWMHKSCTAVSAIRRSFKMPSHSLVSRSTRQFIARSIYGARDVRKMHHKLHDLLGDTCDMYVRCT